MGLIEFLRARLDEDEAVARTAGSGTWCGVSMREEGGATRAQAYHVLRWDPARVLAEVGAKRQRVRMLADLAAACPADDWPESGAMHLAVTADLARHLLLIEAQPYADHLDFDPAWLARSPDQV